MKKTLSKIIIPLAVSAGIAAATPSFADEQGEVVKKQNEVVLENIVKEKSFDQKNWRVDFGATIAFPDLKQADLDVKTGFEDFLRPVAPSIKRFENWHDVLNGSLDSSIARKINVYGTNVWIGVGVSYSKGAIKSGESNVPTVFDSPLNYSFRQDADLLVGNVSALVEVSKIRNFTFEAGAQVSRGRLRTKTEYHSIIQDVTREDFNSTSKIYTTGFAPMLRVTYELSENSGIVFQAMKNFANYKGDTYGTDVIDGTATNSVSKSINNLNGPVFSIFYQGRF